MRWVASWLDCRRLRNSSEFMKLVSACAWCESDFSRSDRSALLTAAWISLAFFWLPALSIEPMMGLHPLGSVPPSLAVMAESATDTSLMPRSRAKVSAAARRSCTDVPSEPDVPRLMRLPCA